MKKNKLNSVKPRWEKPKLIVIARGDSQEGVLVNCKGGATTGVEGGVQDCGVTYPETSVCVSGSAS